MKTALIVTNVHNSQTSVTEFSGAQMKVPFSSGKLVDVLADPLDTTKESTYTVPASGTLSVRVSSRATKVLMPEADAKAVLDALARK